MPECWWNKIIVQLKEKEFFRSIQYGKIAQFLPNCCVIGHKVEDCRMNDREERRVNDLVQSDRNSTLCEGLNSNIDSTAMKEMLLHSTIEKTE